MDRLSNLPSRYLQALAAICGSEGHTFQHEARRLQFSLTEPGLNIRETLFQLDRHPTTPFEEYLKAKVQSRN